MDSLLQLLKDHRVGIWCRRGAWIILAIGLMRIALEIYNILFINNNALVINPLAASSFVTPEVVSIAAELTTLAEFLFYFFILYAAAVAIEHLTGSTKKENLDLEVEDVDEEDLEMEDLDEEVPERLEK